MLTKEEIDSLIRETVKLEGGYVHDPVDPGGETKFGISKKSYPYLDILELTEDEAIEIYRQDYWEPVVNPDDPARVQWKVFDIAVNMGPQISRGFRQNVPTYPKLTAEEWAILHGLSTLQMRRYAGLVISNPKLVKFLLGWTNRGMKA
jgi:lysozyme family protein